MYVERVRNSGGGNQQPSGHQEQRQRHSCQTHFPPPSQPSTPSQSTVSSLHSDEDKYWQAVDPVDPNDQDFCALFEDVSISGTGKKLRKTQPVREMRVPPAPATPAPRASGSQFPSTPPTNPPRQCSVATVPLSPLPSPFTPSPHPLTPHRSPQPQTYIQQSPSVATSRLPPSHRKKSKKYYVVTRGRQIGIFTDW